MTADEKQPTIDVNDVLQAKDQQLRGYIQSEAIHIAQIIGLSREVERLAKRVKELEEKQ